MSTPVPQRPRIAPMISFISVFPQPWTLQNGAACGSVTDTRTTAHHSPTLHSNETSRTSSSAFNSKPSMRFPSSLIHFVLAGLWCPASPMVSAQEPIKATSESAQIFSKIGPKDLILVRVFQEDDLESTLRVAEDGTVT